MFIGLVDILIIATLVCQSEQCLSFPIPPTIAADSTPHENSQMCLIIEEILHQNSNFTETWFLKSPSVLFVPGFGTFQNCLWEMLHLSYSWVIFIKIKKKSVLSFQPSLHNCLFACTAYIGLLTVLSVKWMIRRMCFTLYYKFYSMIDIVCILEFPV